MASLDTSNMNKLNTSSAGSVHAAEASGSFVQHSSIEANQTVRVMAAVVHAQEAVSSTATTATAVTMGLRAITPLKTEEQGQKPVATVEVQSVANTVVTPTLAFQGRESTVAPSAIAEATSQRFDQYVTAVERAFQQKVNTFISIIESALKKNDTNTREALLLLLLEEEPACFAEATQRLFSGILRQNDSLGQMKTHLSLDDKSRLRQFLQRNVAHKELGSPLLIEIYNTHNGKRLFVSYEDGSTNRWERSFFPEGIRKIVDYLKALKRRTFTLPCIVCDNVPAFKKAIQRVIEDEQTIYPQTFVINCSGEEEELETRHSTPFFVDKTDSGDIVVFNTDSLGETLLKGLIAERMKNAYLAIRAMKPGGSASKKCHVVVSAELRQADANNCVVFALHDVMQYNIYKEQLHNIFRSFVFEETEEESGYRAQSLIYFPIPFMKPGQSFASIIGKYFEERAAHEQRDMTSERAVFDQSLVRYVETQPLEQTENQSPKKINRFAEWRGDIFEGRLWRDALMQAVSPERAITDTLYRETLIKKLQTHSVASLSDLEKAQLQKTASYVTTLKLSGRITQSLDGIVTLFPNLTSLRITNSAIDSLPSLPAKLEKFILSGCDALSTVETALFSRCTNLKHVEITQCRGLESFNAVLPPSVEKFSVADDSALTTIDSRIFSQCTNLKEASFAMCDELAALNCLFPDSVQKLNFSNCSRVVFGATVFSQCSQLTEFNHELCDAANDEVIQMLRTQNPTLRDRSEITFSDDEADYML